MRLHCALDTLLELDRTALIVIAIPITQSLSL